MGLFKKKEPAAKKLVPTPAKRGPQPAHWPKRQCWACGGSGVVLHMCPTFSTDGPRHKCRYGCRGGNIATLCTAPGCVQGRVDGG